MKKKMIKNQIDLCERIMFFKKNEHLCDFNKNIFD